MATVIDRTLRRMAKVRRNVRRAAGERARLSVFRSSKHIYAQVIDDAKGQTLASASSLEKDMRDSLKTGANVEAAKAVGKRLAERASAKGVKQVVFDRGGYLYHGRVKALADAAREGGLKLEDLQGGTFTITNGGTFGSLMSTPIVNPPQSAILGMHAIKERPIAENGQVVIAPMMYIALSYDHRIIDGKDAVLFLVDIKNQLENPHRMLLGL